MRMPIILGIFKSNKFPLMFNEKVLENRLSFITFVEALVAGSKLAKQFTLKLSTEQEYKNILSECRELFSKKAADYGTAWRILRLPSITDQIFIKANRIRSIQEKGITKVGDTEHGEFVAIINYGLIALIQLRMKNDNRMELPLDELMNYYDEEAEETLRLLSDKNHDYGEAWRDMRVSSITDIILMKILRVKQIEDNEGKTLVSEGTDANYRDMINYAVFALIKLNEGENS